MDVWSVGKAIFQKCTFNGPTFRHVVDNKGVHAVCGYRLKDLVALLIGVKYCIFNPI
jgi:hypothetical protein